MIEIRGWVIMVIDKQSDYLSMLQKMNSLCKDQFAIYNCNIHNAVAAIHIFDFSNHLGEKYNIIQKVENYLNSLNFDVQ